MVPSIRAAANGVIPECPLADSCTGDSILLCIETESATVDHAAVSVHPCSALGSTLTKSLVHMMESCAERSQQRVKGRDGAGLVSKFLVSSLWWGVSLGGVRHYIYPFDVLFLL